MLIKVSETTTFILFRIYLNENFLKGSWENPNDVYFDGLSLF